MAIARISPTDPPSAEQLNTERAERFHQDGKALLTTETVRAWISSTGLALYLPRPDQLPAPAPSFVEATIGAATPEPTQEQLEQARGILARLISEGTCVPLNLLGASGGAGTDMPDFVCSPAVFSFLFTLRGNKAWKVSPVTSGPVKVSPLALNTYEMLVEKITLTAYDLTTQLGKEVTEAAVLRALTELWQQLRVMPVPQTDGSGTLWELSTARFTKQIKAGANAGQPTALSALISLYLNQAIAATEDEVETFLSPLAPRSRLRSVVHDLIAARQLETIVIDGKTLVHIAGDLPSFKQAQVAAGEGAPSAEGAAETADGEPGVAEAEDGSRIRKFTPNPAAKLGAGLRARPAFGGKPAFGKKPGFGGKPAFGRGGAPGGGSRRPFGAGSTDRPQRPSFNKPWEEDRAQRPAAGEAGSMAASGVEGEKQERPAFRPRPAFGGKPGFGSRPGGSRPGGDRPAFRDNPAYRDRPERPRRESGSGDSRPPRPGGFGARPARPFGDRPAGDRPPFSPRDRGEGTSSDGPRRTFSKPGTFGRKREGGFDGGGARPPRRDFGAGGGSGEGRPPRREFGSDRPAGGGFKRPGSFGGPRPERSFSGPREGGFAARPERSGGFAPRKPFTQREGGDRPAFGGRPGFGGKPAFGNRQSFGGKPSFSRPDGAGAPSGGGEGEAPRKTFRKFDAPRGPKPFGAKPFGARKSFDGPGSSGAGDSRSAFAAKGGPFAKFADGKKPFRKPGKPTGGGAGGGFTPTRRKRPDEGA